MDTREEWLSSNDPELLKEVISKLLLKAEKQKAAHREQVNSLTKEVRFLEAEIERLKKDSSQFPKETLTSSETKEGAVFEPIVDSRTINLPEKEIAQVTPVPGVNVVSLAKIQSGPVTAVLCGTANSLIKLFPLSRSGRAFESVQGTIKCPGPPISMSTARMVDGSFAGIAGCMDGSVVTFTVTVNSTEEEAWGLEKTEVFSRLHPKFVTSMAWNSAGTAVITGSSDGMCCLFTVDPEGAAGTAGGGITLSLGKKLYFEAPVETICCAILPEKDIASAQCIDWFAIAVRGTPCVHYVRVQDGGCVKVPLNTENDRVPLPWERKLTDADDFPILPVGFTVLALACSGDGKYMAHATDQGQVAVYMNGTNQVFRRLTGHTSSKWATPQLAWHPATSAYLFGTSEVDYSVYVWNVPSGRVVQQLLGHTAAVRGLLTLRGNDENLDEALVATGSFDKTVRLWWK